MPKDPVRSEDVLRLPPPARKKEECMSWMSPAISIVWPSFCRICSDMFLLLLIACVFGCSGRFSLRFSFFVVWYMYALFALFISPLLQYVLDRFYRGRRSLRRSQTFTFEAGGTATFNDFGFGDKDGYIDWTTNTTREVRSCSRDFSRGFFLGLKTAMANLEPCVTRRGIAATCALSGVFS